MGSLESPGFLRSSPRFLTCAAMLRVAIHDHNSASVSEQLRTHVLIGLLPTDVFRLTLSLKVRISIRIDLQASVCDALGETDWGFSPYDCFAYLSPESNTFVSTSRWGPKWS